jgi:hypothetical protein
MATLFDLAQQYLNRALPETFKYDRTQPPTIGPITKPIQPTPGPVMPLLPRPGGNEEGFSVYNPDPNRTRTSNQYSPYAYRQASERSYIGAPGDLGYSSATAAQKMMDNYPEYYQGPQLTGIPGAIANYAKASPIMQLAGKGLDALGNMLPVNNRAILENELLGQGFQLNDIGQIVSDGGDYDTAANVMSGYNANQITRQTFEKRRNKIKETMSKPGYKGNLQERLDALDEAEAKFFAGSDRATTVFNDKLKQKDIDDGFINDQGSTYDEEIPSFIIDNNIIGPGKGINTFPGMGNITPMGPIVTGPTYGPYSSGGGGITSVPTKTLANKNINRINDYINIGGGGGRDNDRPAPTAPAKTSQGVTTSQFQAFKGSSKTPSSGTGSGGLGDYQIQPSKPTRSLKTTKPGTSGGSSGGNNSCFLPNTLVTMIDGSTKKIIDVDIGDEVAEGGKVFATGKFLNNELYDYKGVKVSGSHMVNEDGIWMRVRDTKHGKPLGDEEHTVYVFGSENRRILINNILFTDYFEVNEQDKLMNNEEDFFDNWKLYAKQDSGNNVDIINAS